MITLIAHHGVTDYENWLSNVKKINSDSDLAAQMGIVESHVYRTVDGSGVIVTHTFNNLEDAQAHANKAGSAEFRASVEEMGGAPPYTLWLAEEANLL